MKAYCDRCQEEILPSQQEIGKLTYFEKQVSLGPKEMQEKLFETSQLFCEKCINKIKEFIKK